MRELEKNLLLDLRVEPVYKISEPKIRTQFLKGTGDRYQGRQTHLYHVFVKFGYGERSSSTYQARRHPNSRFRFQLSAKHQAPFRCRMERTLLPEDRPRRDPSSILYKGIIKPLSHLSSGTKEAHRNVDHESVGRQLFPASLGGGNNLDLQ